MRDLWSDHPIVDVVGAAITAVVVLILAPFVTLSIAPGERFGVYASAGGLAALVSGIVAVGISLQMAGMGPRARVLRRQMGATLRRNWTASLLGVAGSAFVCWSAQLVDAAVGPRAGAAAVAAGLAWFLLLTLRQTWLFAQLFALNDRDTDDLERRTPPLGARWRNQEAAKSPEPRLREALHS